MVEVKVSLYKVDFSLIGKSESSLELELFQIFENRKDPKGTKIRVSEGYKIDNKLKVGFYLHLPALFGTSHLPKK